VTADFPEMLSNQTIKTWECQITTEREKEETDRKNEGKKNKQVSTNVCESP
jgi:hypothetical protein